MDAALLYSHRDARDAAAVGRFLERPGRLFSRDYASPVQRALNDRIAYTRLMELARPWALTVYIQETDDLNTFLHGNPLRPPKLSPRTLAIAEDILQTRRRRLLSMVVEWKSTQIPRHRALAVVA